METDIKPDFKDKWRKKCRQIPQALANLKMFEEGFQTLPEKLEASCGVLTETGGGLQRP
ncbi:MAG: hypothetical protein R3D85_16300 [Paracoccaceae bacterium]